MYAYALIEQILVGVQFVFQKRLAQFLLDQAFALAGVLPVGKADLLHDLVDVGDDALDDDVGVLVFGFGEELGERLLGPVALFFRICLLFRFNDFLGDFEDLLEEFQASEEALLMAFLDFFQTFAQRHELGISQMLAQPGNQHDLDLARLSSPGPHPSGSPQHLSVQNERLDVVTDRFHVDILVDEIHCLGAQSMPEQLAVPAGRLDRLIDLRQPAVILLVRAEQGSGDSASQIVPRTLYSAANLSRISLFGRHCCAGHQSLVADYGPVHAGEERQALLHLQRECFA